jgi:transposase-like protein
MAQSLHCCDLICNLIRLAESQQVTITEIERRAGLSRGTIFKWKNKASARLDNFVAALGVLGATVVIREGEK